MSLTLPLTLTLTLTPGRHLSRLLFVLGLFSCLAATTALLDNWLGFGLGLGLGLGLRPSLAHASSLRLQCGLHGARRCAKAPLPRALALPTPQGLPRLRGRILLPRGRVGSGHVTRCASVPRKRSLSVSPDGASCRAST